MPVLDTGARGSTTTFAQRGIGDVLHLLGERGLARDRRSSAPDKFEIVIPSLSILAEPPVAVVDKVVLRRGTRDVAREYLEVPVHAGRRRRSSRSNYYRPRDPEVAAKHAEQFPKLELVTIKDFGGWAKAQKEHFGDGGVFDQIYSN